MARRGKFRDYAHSSNRMYDAYFAPELTEDEIISTISHLSLQEKQYFIFSVIRLVVDERLFGDTCANCKSAVLEKIVKCAIMAGFPKRAFSKVEKIIKKYGQFMLDQDHAQMIETYLSMVEPLYERNYDQRRDLDLTSALPRDLIFDLASIVQSYVSLEYQEPEDEVKEPFAKLATVNLLIETIYGNVIAKNHHLTEVVAHGLATFENIVVKMQSYFAHANGIFVDKMMASFKHQVRLAVKNGERMADLNQMRNFFQLTQSDPDNIFGEIIRPLVAGWIREFTSQ